MSKKIGIIKSAYNIKGLILEDLLGQITIDNKTNIIDFLCNYPPKLLYLEYRFKRIGLYKYIFCTIDRRYKISFYLNENLNLSDIMYIANAKQIKKYYPVLFETKETKIANIIQSLKNKS